MIYGANGFTGQLVARLAVRRGQRPILAGRDAYALAALGGDLGLPYRVVPLTDAAGLRDALHDVAVVAHCAGPFIDTSEPMVSACLAARAHYVDITGELPVLERVYARHDEARDAGVVLLPGAGFDVVPTDCLAVGLRASLPTAVRLDLAWLAGGGLSAGTLRASLREMADGNLRRVDGELRPTPPGEPERVVPFPSGPRRVGAIRWGDLISAYRSTGIPTITVYTRLPGRRGPARRAAGAVVRALLGYPATRRLAVRAIGRGRTGPDPARRARSVSEVWAEVADAAGETRSATLVLPNGYDFTADAVVASVGHLMSRPVPPGAHTPATAFGAGFVRELDGVEFQPGPTAHR
jgi:short subunit dehydrogenase-like uncharacterized protein